MDDLRPPPDGRRPSKHFPGQLEPGAEWIWSKTGDDAIDVLDHTPIDVMRSTVISLDHDLGGEDTTRPIILWLCEHGGWPAEIHVHTANPVGRRWLEGMIERYHPNNGK